MTSASRAVGARLLAVALVVALSGLPGPLGAQDPLPVPPPPPRLPAVERLAYFIGTWSFVRQDTTGPALTSRGTVTWQWFPGELSILGRLEADSAEGAPLTELMVFGYAPAAIAGIGEVATQDAYVWYAVGRKGASRDVARFSTTGNLWRSESASGVRGTRGVLLRRTIAELSATSYSYTVDGSADGRSWTRLTSMTATKLK